MRFLHGPVTDSFHKKPPTMPRPVATPVAIKNDCATAAEPGESDMERTPNRRDEERRARPNIITQLSDRVQLLDQYVDSRVDCFSETKQVVNKN